MGNWEDIVANIGPVELSNSEDMLADIPGGSDYSKMLANEEYAASPLHKSMLPKSTLLDLMSQGNSLFANRSSNFEDDDERTLMMVQFLYSGLVLSSMYGPAAIANLLHGLAGIIEDPVFTKMATNIAAQVTDFIDAHIEVERHNHEQENTNGQA